MIKQIQWKQYRYLLAAFILPFLILGAIYACFQVYPFGTNSVLVLDLNGQYVSYFEGLRDALLSGKSILYSWSRSLSGEMLGIFAYYLASPFSLLVALFPKANITEAIYLMTLCKIGMAGVFSAYYFHDKKLPDFYKVMLGVCYALCSYAVVQAMNIMWLDAVLLLPLLLLGVERLLFEKRYWMFTLTLIALFITNYYLGYMLGIFSFLYFCYLLVLHWSTLSKWEYMQAVIRFFTQAFLAVLSCLFLLLPTIYSLTLGKTTFTSPDYSIFSKFDFFDFFLKLLPSSYDSVNVQGLPFIYVGVIALLFIPLYFMNRKITAKEKCISFGFLVLLIMMMNISLVDLMMHGFQSPNWLNYRYAFSFSFMLLILIGRCIAVLDGIRPKDVAKVYGFSLVFIIAVQRMDISFIGNETTIWLSLLCLSIYALCLSKLTMQYNRYTQLIILIILCGELFVSSMVSLRALDAEVIYSTRESYAPFMHEIRVPMAKIAQDDPGFYRMEKTFHRTVNDPMSLGMRGISHSTSTLNADALTFIRRMGYSTRDHWSKYLGNTPVNDALLGIRYVLSKEMLTEYELVFTYEDISAYSNPYALSIGFGANQALQKVDMLNFSPFALQNDMLSAMLGWEKTEFFKPVEVLEIIKDNVSEHSIAGHTLYEVITPGINAQIEYVLSGSEDANMYAYFPSQYEREVNLWMDGVWVDTFFGHESYRIMDLKQGGDYERSLIMTVVNEEVYLRENVPYFYYLDKELFAQAIEQLNAGSWQVEAVSERHLLGSVTIADNQSMMYTSIPYEKGWTVYVDGKKVPYYKIADALIGFDIAPGTHDVIMKFIPYGMVSGGILSIAGIIMMIMLFRDDCKKRKKTNVSSLQSVK